MIPKEYIKKIIEKTIKNFSKDDIYFDLESKNIPSFGDYSTNVAFSLAKTLKKNPIEVAQEIKSEIEKNKSKYIKKIEVAGNGFVNFFLDKNIYFDEFKKTSGGKIKKINIGKNKKIIVEYSSPNIAKPMHIGHLRATIVGDFLARLYKELGYKVIRWNHIGDWGTQFGMIICAYKKWGSKKEIDQKPIETLLDLYVRFNKEAKENETLHEEAKQEFAKLEKGDKENKKLWQWFVKLSLKEFEKTYKLLGVEFDVIKGESFYEKDLIPFINNQKKTKTAVMSDGAYVVMLDNQKLPPALLQKGDGATLYMTRDLVSLVHRIKKYKPIEILYVVGNQQIMHFKQFFAVAEILKINKKTKTKHISFGWILGEDGKKLATREGKIITAQSLIDEIISSAYDIVDQKRTDVSKKEKEKIAQAIGIGSLKYNLLKDYRDSDIIYDSKKALAMKGNSHPYINYAYARISNILKKTKKIGVGDFNLLEDLDALIIKKIFSFEEILIKSAKDNTSNYLTDYLFELADLTNTWYEKNQILKDENGGRKNARLVLIKNICSVLERGLEILGTKTLKNI